MIYNKHNCSAAVNEIMIDVDNNITQTDIREVDRVTDILIKDIILKLGAGKSDELFDWGTDALIVGVNVIAPHFTSLFKSFLIHGHISELFLCCALLPIVKNARDSKFTCENYRFICDMKIYLRNWNVICI